MVICQSLAEACAVPGVIAIVSGAQIKAYVQGDVLPPEAIYDNSADVARVGAIDASIAATALGAVQPASVAQLKSMSVTEYGTWFDANFTTSAQLTALLKRVVLIVVRRVL